MSLRDPGGPSQRSSMTEVESGHLPVMVEEVMTPLSPLPGSAHVDATVGGGGHALRILEAASPDGLLLGLDADPAAVARAGRRLARFGDRVTLRQANFEDVAQVAAETGFERVDGILMDLGLSSDQLADVDRGFSFRATGDLDMRFDPPRGTPAAEVLASLDERELDDLFRRYGEEPHARRIARAVVAERKRRPIREAAHLAAVVEAAVPTPPWRRRIHPATRVFQALRIHVNRELEVLPNALESTIDLLKPGAHLCVISYHSLEDRIVKRFIARERRGCVCPSELPVCACGRQPRLAPVGGTRPQLPTEEEIANNPRARSARLRVARRLAA
jgi:16S rRNA (cytosine1402-N4)-methyltransferase